jgi:hypothetical protein
MKALAPLDRNMNCCSDDKIPAFDARIPGAARQLGNADINSGTREAGAAFAAPASLRSIVPSGS